MQVLPELWEWSLGTSPDSPLRSALPTLRGCLITSVVAIDRAANTNALANFAVDYARRKSPYNGAARAAHYAAAAAGHDDFIAIFDYSVDAVSLAVAVAGDPIWSNVRSTCTALLAGSSNHGALWSDPSRFSQLWSDLRPKILEKGEGWRFWVDWYDKALRGEPQDISLLTKVALIDNADWERGPDHVNALIAKIVQDHARKPARPRPTDVERSHIALVLAVPEPAWQSAEFLRDQFDRIACAYVREIGCPNMDPPEIEPIRILSQTFGNIAVLLREAKDKDRIIAELTIQLRMLEANNAQLVAALQGEKSALMRGIVIGALGDLAARTIWEGAALGGPSIRDSLGPLWEFLKPPSPGLPAIPMPPQVIET